LTRSPDGLVPPGPKGHVPAQSQSGARDVATDVGSPPSAVRRLARSAGHRVPDHDRSPRPERREHDTVEVHTWRGRMVPHTRPQGFQRLRDDGVPATRTLAKVKALRREAVAKGEGVVKGAVQRIARLTSRQRYEQSTGRDPWRCPHGQSPRDGWRLWHPTYGVSDDEGEVSKRGPSP